MEAATDIEAGWARQANEDLLQGLYRFYVKHKMPLTDFVGPALPLPEPLFDTAPVEWIDE